MFGLSSSTFRKEQIDQGTHSIRDNCRPHKTSLSLSLSLLLSLSILASVLCHIHTHTHTHTHTQMMTVCVRAGIKFVPTCLRARAHTHTLDAPVCSKSLECESAAKNQHVWAAALVRAPNCQELMLAGRVGAGTQPAAALGSPLPMCVFSVCS